MNEYLNKTEMKMKKTFKIIGIIILTAISLWVLFGVASFVYIKIFIE